MQQSLGVIFAILWVGVPLTATFWVGNKPWMRFWNWKSKLFFFGIFAYLMIFISCAIVIGHHIKH